MTKRSLAEIASGLENSLIKRMLRAINESPTLKALEAYRQSPTFQVYRASPVFSVVEAYRNSAAFKAMELRSEEHTSELQSLMRISYAVFCLKKKQQN